MVKLDPSTGDPAASSTRTAPTRPEPRPITLDMEFAEEGGEGATPYEVLLHAAMVGDSIRFTRQDGVEETWRIMQPLLDAPPPVHPYAPGSWGPGGRRRAGRRPRRLARAVDRVVSHATAPDRRAPQSAAAPSPFPPIADYAFLSNCHTGALVAPDGAIDWLCVPSFDSPSVFGSLLDREAGLFRFGPFGINHPAGRAPTSRARTCSSTTWKTPTGWIVVRDALTMGPRDREDDGHAAHPAAGGRRRRPHARADGRVHRGARSRSSSSASRSFDYGRTPAEWTLVDGDRHAADATGAGQTIRLRHRPRARDRGQPRPRPARARGRRAGLLRAVVGRGAGRARRRRRGRASGSPPRRGSGAPGSGGARIPDHRWRDPIQRSALAIKGLTYMPTGATVAALTTSLPETPGGERNWDYRYTWMRDTTFTLQALHWLNLDWEADEFMQFVADLEPTEDGSLQIMYGIDGRRDLTESTRDDLSGYAGARPGADRQRRVRPAPERRLRRRARLDPAPHATQPAPAAPAVADRRVAGRVRDEGLARARPGHLGGARRAAALRLVEADVLGRARPRREARRDPRRPRAGGDVARDRRGDPRRHPRARRHRRGVLRQHYETDALDASTLLAAIFGFLPGDDERLRATVLAIADELTEDGFVLRYRTDETDDGLSGKEGTFLICSFWLVSALAIVGEMQRARDLMERLLRIASPLGLYAEEFEPTPAGTSATSRRRSRTWP